MDKKIHVVALAGGVGGAKLADGLSGILEPDCLSVIVNTGDDLKLCGLQICPDLDTVCYTLAGLANPVTGWGRKDETWEVFSEIQKLEGPDWFKLGDHDIAFHLARTNLLDSGLSITETTKILCRKIGVLNSVLPMTDSSVRTIVHTKDGRDLGFQEYFVKENCEPVVTGFTFKGMSHAVPTEAVINAIENADLVVLCPSNPWVSIDPILKLPGLREKIQKKVVVAVSPIIGGKTIKGPAAKMFLELGMLPGTIEVAKHYLDFLSGLVIDAIDHDDADSISAAGIIPLVTGTIMRTKEDRTRLAKETIEFGLKLHPKG